MRYHNCRRYTVNKINDAVNFPKLLIVCKIFKKCMYNKKVELS